MPSFDLTPTSFAYTDCDIPDGQTLVGWRDDRHAARRQERPTRRTVRLPRLLELPLVRAAG